MPDLDSVLQLATSVTQCALAVLLLLLSVGALDFGVWERILVRLSPVQKAVLEKSAELARERAALDQIPMMDEFSAHMKKKRVVDRLERELKALLATRSKSRLTGALLWNLAGRSISFGAALYLATLSQELIVTTVKSTALWPFNILVSYPATSGTESTIPVTLFCYLIHAFLVFKIYRVRRTAVENERMETMKQRLGLSKTN